MSDFVTSSVRKKSLSSDKTIAIENEAVPARRKQRDRKQRDRKQRHVDVFAIENSAIENADVLRAR